SVPDVSGDAPGGRLIEPGGPDGIFATLPLTELRDALAGLALSVCISNSAGSYLCNHLMYRLLTGIQQKQLGIPAGFVHIPPAAAPASTRALRAADPRT